MNEIGFAKGWIGPTDYRCEVCHLGFMLDEIVYIEKEGLPFHKECVEPMDFGNRMRRGVEIIPPSQRRKEIDYNAGSVFGGHIKDYPEPNIRRWPGCPDKRAVRVSISRYYGIGEHYFVTIEQEDNPIWSEKERKWITCWDDTEGKGLTDMHMYLYGDLENRGPFDSYGQASHYAKKMVEKYFPDHEVKMEDYCVDFENLEGAE